MFFIERQLIASYSSKYHTLTINQYTNFLLLHKISTTYYQRMVSYAELQAEQSITQKKEQFQTNCSYSYLILQLVNRILL